MKNSIFMFIISGLLVGYSFYVHDKPLLALFVLMMAVQLTVGALICDTIEKKFEKSENNS